MEANQSAVGVADGVGTKSVIFESCIMKTYSAVVTNSDGTIYLFASPGTYIFRTCYIQASGNANGVFITDNSSGTITAEFQSCKIVGSGTGSGIQLNAQIAKLYNCRIEKGASATYAVTGTTDGNVTIGGCSLDGTVNTAITTRTYKMDFTPDESTLIFDSSDNSKLKVKASGITATELHTDAVETDKIKDGNVTAAKLASGIGVTIPVGTIMMYGADADTSGNNPSGWLLCNGYAASRTTYADLFNKIGTTYGSGDGSTTFNLPDLRGVFPKGAGTTDRTAGKDSVGNYYAGTLGEYKTDKMQGHCHTYDKPTAYTGYANLTAGGVILSFPTGNTTSPVNDGNGAPRTGLTTEPQSVGVNFIIKY